MGGVNTSKSKQFFRGGVKDISVTLLSENHYASVATEETLNDMKKYRIRKLTPIEVFRLMGVSDEDTAKIQAAGISESQQYKMAGNSIVVPVLEGLFTQMFRTDSDALF